MKSLRLFAPQDLRLVDDPAPTPQPDEALVRILAAGICGSDLHWLTGGGIGENRLSAPLVLGHELAGVAETGRLSGKLVAIDPAVPCGECRFCREGNPNFCERLRFSGDGIIDGGFRQVMAWPERNLLPLPEAITPADGAMLEPLGVALHALDLGRLRAGARVGVFGCGPIGLLLIQLASRMAPLQVLATEVLPHRRQAAHGCGAYAVFDAADPELAVQVQSASQGQGLDVIFEAAGDNAAVEAAVACARPGATLILIGIPDDNRIAFTASVARRKGLTLKLVRRMKNTYPRAIALVQNGQVDVRSLVSHRFPLDDYEKAFRTAERREGLKVILEPDA